MSVASARCQDAAAFQVRQVEQLIGQPREAVGLDSISAR